MKNINWIEVDKKIINLSEADELFDELNYIKMHDNKRRIVYKRGFDKIEFLHKYKEIVIDTTLNAEELKAINLKCKELGWVEE